MQQDELSNAFSCQSSITYIINVPAAVRVTFYESMLAPKFKSRFQS